jgi:hypothetical protein
MATKSKRKSRTSTPSPVDPFRDPGITISQADLNELPTSWRAAIEQSTHWPFPNPDEVLSLPEEELAEIGEKAAEKAESLAPDTDVEIVPYTEHQPWGKMDVESERQYELFSYYRSLGRARTQTDVAKHFDVSRAYISKTASDRGWADRIDAWDTYKEQIYAQTVLEGVKEMAVKHAEIARDGIMVLSKPFEVLMQRLESEEGQNDLWEMNLQSLFKLVQKSTQILPNLMNAERLSRGMPTEISEQTTHENHTIRLETSDELADLLFGLAEAIPGIESADEHAEYLEVEFEEETRDDDTRRAIAAAAEAHPED